MSGYNTYHNTVMSIQYVSRYFQDSGVSILQYLNIALQIRSCIFAVFANFLYMYLHVNFIKVLLKIKLICFL